MANPQPTEKQGQYLAFIYYYTKVNGQPPAEADMQRYFAVSPPSVHQMVLTLEKHRWIERIPGRGRSITLVSNGINCRIWSKTLPGHVTKPPAEHIGYRVKCDHHSLRERRGHDSMLLECFNTEGPYRFVAQRHCLVPRPHHPSEMRRVAGCGSVKEACCSFDPVSQLLKADRC